MMSYIYKLSSFLILVIVLVSCDDRYEQIRTFNSVPVITLTPESTTPNTVVSENQKKITDSVKTGGVNNYFPFTVHVADANQNIKSVFYKVNSGSGVMVIGEKDTIKENETLPLIDGSMLMRFFPYGTANTVVSIHVQDRFDAMDTAILDLRAFANKPPVAVFNATFVGENSVLEWELNGSSSVDQDNAYGGYIVEYSYKVNSEIIKTTRPSIRYIFPTPGVYNIEFSVKDNDNAISNLITQQITVTEK